MSSIFGKRSDLAQWNAASGALGAIAWGMALLLRQAGALGMDEMKLLLLLAALVIVPLALPLARRASPTADSGYRLALIAQPCAAMSGAIALLAPTGSIAATITAALWLLYTALLGLLGVVTLVRMLLARRVALAELCLSLALVYLPIGGAWFALARLGVRPLGFSPTTVLLTAVHFHFITLAALVITGCTGFALGARQGSLAQIAYRIAAAGMLICPLVVAAGITLTQLTGQRALESLAATLLALSLTLVALLSLRFAVPATESPLAQGLLAFSSCSVLLTMALATAYAVGRLTGAWTITVAQMVATHGWLNALAFGCCGLLGWRLQTAWERARRGG